MKGAGPPDGESRRRLAYEGSRDSRLKYDKQNNRDKSFVKNKFSWNFFEWKRKMNPRIFIVSKKDGKKRGGAEPGGRQALPGGAGRAAGARIRSWSPPWKMRLLPPQLSLESLFLRLRCRLLRRPRSGPRELCSETNLAVRQTRPPGQMRAGQKPGGQTMAIAFVIIKNKGGRGCGSLPGHVGRTLEFAAIVLVLLCGDRAAHAARVSSWPWASASPRNITMGNVPFIATRTRRPAAKPPSFVRLARPVNRRVHPKPKCRHKKKRKKRKNFLSIKYQK